MIQPISIIKIDPPPLVYPYAKDTEDAAVEFSLESSS